MKSINFFLIFHLLSLSVSGSSSISTSALELKPPSYLQERIPYELFDIVIGYINSPCDLCSLRVTCCVALLHVNILMHESILNFSPQLVTLFSQKMLILSSISFGDDLRAVKAQGFGHGELTETDLTLLILWNRIQPDRVYISISLWRKLNRFYPSAFKGSLATCPGVIYISPSILKLQLLRDATARLASRVVFFMCKNEESTELLDTLFSLLLRFVIDESSVRSFYAVVELLLARLRVNLEWFEKCLDQENIALFDALVNALAIDDDGVSRPDLARIYNESLLYICENGLHSRILLHLPEIPDILMPEAMNLCIRNGNWKMATEILRQRNLDTLAPTISLGAAQALKALVLEFHESFTAESFHERFGLERQLLQIVAMLGFPEFYVTNRFEILLKSGYYQVSKSPRVSAAYRKYINDESCTIN